MTAKKLGTSVLMSAALVLAVFSSSCGEDAGLYKQEQLIFDVNSSPELDLSEEESLEFSYHGFFGVPLPPWPVFDYYQFPLPVYVPVNPNTNLIEWIHPMYIDLYLSGEFGPRD